MSTEIIRRAASVARERAHAATPGPWGPVAGAFGNPSDGPDHMRVAQAPHRNAIDAIARTEYDPQGGADAEHIASWHPAVALAVADLLDLIVIQGGSFWPTEVRTHALAVARAYLGEAM